MNSKVSIVIATMTIQLLITAQVHAQLPPQKTLQFYAGLSGGINQMSGKRSESVDTPAAAETTVFSNQQNFNDRKAQYAAFAGASYFIPQTKIFIGPEIYVGRGHGEQELQKSVFDPGVGDRRILTSSFSQSVFFGGTLKGGYNFGSCLGYVILGGESSLFKSHINYVPFAPDPSGSYKSSKWLKGFLWGIGLEKRLNNILLGADVRFVQYGKFKVQSPHLPSRETVFASFKPKNIRFSLRLSYVF